MQTIDLNNGLWEPWGVERSPLGQHRPWLPVPTYVLMYRSMLEHADYVALEERRDGTKYVEVFGIRFEVIGYHPEADLFGLKRV